MVPNVFRCLVLVLSLLLAVIGQKTNEKVLLVLIQGFPNYFLKYYKGTDNTLIGFEKIMRHGVLAEYVVPEFPTLTPPNFYSILTGEHPDSHGITSEFMYDAVSDRYFKGFKGANDWDVRWWNSSTPVYVTAAEQGKKCALYWWPGCQIQYSMTAPVTCHESLDSNEQPVVSYISSILQQLNEGLDMAMIYYKLVDHHSKMTGPYSDSTKTQVAHISSVLYELQSAMEAFEMDDQVNLIVLSDRGISDVQLHDLYFIDDFLDVNLLKRVVNEGPLVQLYPYPGKSTSVHESLSLLPHSRIYWRDQLPERWHIRKSKHLAPLTLVADPGYAIYCRRCESVASSHSLLKESEGESSLTPHFDKGSSGYDNSALDMRAIFMARGPSFKENAETSWLRTVDVYPLLCHLLSIDCKPHQGSWARVQSLLVNSAPHTLSSHASLLFTVIIYGLTFILRPL